MEFAERIEIVQTTTLLKLWKWKTNCEIVGVRKALPTPEILNSIHQIFTDVKIHIKW